MSDLAEKMRTAREFVVEIDGLSLVCRRPTKADYVRMNAKKTTLYDVAEEFVVGWRNVTEADLVPSGGSDPVPFDRETWVELLADRAELWLIGEHIQRAYLEHNNLAEDRAKN